jgi:lipoprotein-releasing system permease protein
MGESLRSVLPLLLPWIAAALLLVLILPSLTYALLLRVLPILAPGRAFEVLVGGRYLRSRRFPRLISAVTYISVSGVTLGVMALIIVIGVMTGFESDLKRKILGTNSHIIVVPQAGGAIEGYRELSENIRAMPGVTGAAPFILSQAMLGSPGAVQGVVLRGVDPRGEGAVTDLARNLVVGKLADLDPDPEGARLPGVILGAELARNLDTAPGGEVRVISAFGSTTPGGVAPAVTRCSVVGIFKSGMYEYDSSLAYVALPVAQELFDTGDVATGIEVRVEEFDRSLALAGLIQGRLGGGYWVRDWSEMNHALFAAIRLEKMAMFVILTLIVLVASFSIVGSLIMKVIEKGKDIAILKSMGATPAQVRRVFVFGGFLIGSVGTLLGVALGWGACLALERYKFIPLPSSVYYIDTLPVEVDPALVGLIAAAAMAISVLATLYPAWKASRLDPIPALRYE